MASDNGKEVVKLAEGVVASGKRAIEAYKLGDLARQKGKIGSWCFYIGLPLYFVALLTANDIEGRIVFFASQVLCWSSVVFNLWSIWLHKKAIKMLNQELEVIEGANNRLEEINRMKNDER